MGHASKLACCNVLCCAVLAHNAHVLVSLALTLWLSGSSSHCRCGMEIMPSSLQAKCNWLHFQ